MLTMIGYDVFGKDAAAARARKHGREYTSDEDGDGPSPLHISFAREEIQANVAAGFGWPDAEAHADMGQEHATSCWFDDPIFDGDGECRDLRRLAAWAAAESAAAVRTVAAEALYAPPGYYQFSPAEPDGGRALVDEYDEWLEGGEAGRQEAADRLEERRDSYMRRMPPHLVADWVDAYESPEEIAISPLRTSTGQVDLGRPIFDGAPGIGPLRQRLAARDRRRVRNNAPLVPVHRHPWRYSAGVVDAAGRYNGGWLAGHRWQAGRPHAGADALE